MFHEEAPGYQTLYDLIGETRGKMLVVIGTSGQVLDVSGMARYYGCSVLNNLHPEPMIDSHFTKVFNEAATAAAPKIALLVEDYLTTGKLCEEKGRGR
jgi:hypothetical protein